MKCRLHFLGAARTVTGSRYLLETEKQRWLIDCGLFQGGRALKERNWQPFPVAPASLDAVILTHAHIDHTGYLPRLVQAGFRGPIYSTPATADLLSLVLPDSGHLQEEDAEFANRKKYSRHRPALPLYTEQEGRDVLPMLKPTPYHHGVELGRQLRFEYLYAGHILGSAIIRMTLLLDGTRRTLVFSGDLGRAHQPIIRDPEIVEDADFLLLESTYGNRRHQNLDTSAFLEELVNDTARRGGSLIIPAFAVGRSQRVLYLLRQLEEKGRIPSLPIFLDSPMAVNAVDIYCSHLEEHDLEMELLMSKACPLHSGNIHLVRAVEDSKALHKVRHPCIIVSASGNLAGGRILHHLKNRLSDSRNSVLFVGYLPQDSLGRLIAEGRKSVKIHGRQVEVRARVAQVDALSAHADSRELLDWVEHFRRTPQRIFLVHGEPPAQEALKASLEKATTSRVSIPEHLESVELR